MYYQNGVSKFDDPKETVSEINKEWMKRCIYVIFSDVTGYPQGGGSIYAFTAKDDVEKYMRDDANSNEMGVENAGDLKLIHGLVLDQQKLPMKLDSKLMKDRSFWVLLDSGNRSIQVEECADLDEVTQAIELAVENEDIDIEDVCILLGEEVGLSLTPSKTGDSPTAYQVYGSYS